MRPYRCVNPECSNDENFSRFDFWSAEPVCPKCGASGKNRESAHLIVPLAIIHLDPITKWGKGLGKRLCTGKPFGGDYASGDPSVVNCPACKSTEIWQKAMATGSQEPLLEITEERASELRELAKALLKSKGATERRGVPLPSQP